MSIAGVSINNIDRYEKAMTKKYTMRPSRRNVTINRLRENGINIATNKNVSNIIKLEDAISITDLFLQRELPNDKKRDVEAERNGYKSELQKIYDRLKEEARPISRGSWRLSHTNNQDNDNYISGTVLKRGKPAISNGGARRTRKHRGRKMRKTRHTSR